MSAYVVTKVHIDILSKAGLSLTGVHRPVGWFAVEPYRPVDDRLELSGLDQFLEPSYPPLGRTSEGER